MAKNFLIGVNTEVPIYGTPVDTTINITGSNIGDYFTVKNNTDYWFADLGGGIFCSNNDGKNSSTAQTTLTAKTDLKNVSFSYSYSSETNYDKFTLKVGTTTVAQQISAAIVSKADVGHTHGISGVDDLAETLDAKYEKPTDGIPKIDLAASVQASLVKADSAIQSLDGYATETYVDTKVGDVIGAAPEMLNTINELSAALGDDPNFAATITATIGNKVDKVTGKGLSTNDYTSEEKTKLAGIAVGANKTVVDAALSDTSVNPVQNKIIASSINNINFLIGDTPVSEQIASAIATKADSDHNHDSRYYTETEVDSMLQLYENQSAFSNVTVGETTITADNVTDTITFLAGDNVTLIPNATNDSITISSIDTVYTHPTSGITAGEYKSVTVDAQGHVTDGENPTTLAGYGITDAASKSVVDNLSDLVGTSSVVAQIEEGIKNKSDVGHKHPIADVLDLNTSLGAKYEKPLTGIPKTDLADTVQTSLNKADSAIQSLAGYATEGYVDTKVAGVIGSAPELLNTLDELSKALGDDPNFATTVVTQIGKKVDKVTGKGLSTNDYTTAEKDKLAGISEGANKYVLPAAGTALGGVKTGGDVTISSGVITVNDDSHNHIISNVDGLQAALDGKSNTSHTHNYAGSATVGGAATSANKLATARTIKIGASSKTFDGSQNVTYSDNEVGFMSLSNVGETIPDATNLDNFADYGNYYVPTAAHAATMTGDLPFDNNGYRMFSYRGYDKMYDRQFAMGSGEDIKMRAKVNSTWKPWKTLEFKGHTHNLADSTITGDLSIAKGGTGASDIKTAANNLMVKSLYAGVLIPANSDLNDYTTPGNYTCNKTADVPTLKNCPVSVAFSLTVYYVLNANYMKQEIEAYNSNTKWQRNCINGSWGVWTMYYTSQKKPTPEDIGAAPSNHNHNIFTSLTEIGITTFPTTMQAVAKAMPKNSMIHIDNRRVTAGISGYSTEVISDWGNDVNGMAIIMKGDTISRVSMMLIYSSATASDGKILYGNYCDDTNSVNWVTSDTKIAWNGSAGVGTEVDIGDMYGCQGWVVVAQTSSSGTMSTVYIPRHFLTTETTRFKFQVADETSFVSFYFYNKTNDTAYIKISETTNNTYGKIRYVYRVN